MDNELIGIISTYNAEDYLENPEERSIETPWGTAQLSLGSLNGRPVALLHRYGPDMSMVQHLVNFRANIWAFRELGVKRLISLDAVGSVRQDVEPGEIVILDDFIDFTQKGSLSYFEEHGCSVRVDMSQPFCPELRSALIEGFNRRNTGSLRVNGTLVGCEGPRFETPAELKMYRGLGADVIGTLLIPEVVLAREAEICLALVAAVTNYAPGLAPRVVRRGEGSMEEFWFHEYHQRIKAALVEALPLLPSQRACPCSQAVPQTIFGALPEWYKK